MNILIDIGHPAQVHLFRHYTTEMINKGHHVYFTARDKDVSTDLLRTFKFNYKSFGKNYKSIAGKLFGLFKFSFMLWLHALKIKPDIYLSHSSAYASVVAWLMRKPHLAFEDTGNMEQLRIAKLFGSIFLTSSSFRKKLSSKQVYYHGYHELAYLHPSYFKPNDAILEKLQLNSEEKIILLRFVSWTASHDLNQTGFKNDLKLKMVKRLSQYGKVFISSEQDLPPEFLPYLSPFPIENMHDLLAFANLYIGEGASMASESAMLGTPAIYINSIETDYCNELQHKYGLIYNFRNDGELLDKAIELLNTADLKEKHLKKREKMLSEKIDVTKFMIWFTENFPESHRIMIQDPEFQDRFK